MKLNIQIIILCLVGLVSTLKIKDSLKFFALGDWGGVPFRPYRTFAQIAVSRAMAHLAEEQNVDFILALGDNFYFTGVKNVDDSRFNETFEHAYKNLFLQIPWLVVAGNHDHYGNASAEIAYSKRSKRWIFPDYYYKKTFVIPSSNSVVDIVMIDTVLLCGNTDLYDPYRQPELLESSRCLAETQWKWLENTLKSSNASYLLVCGHFPVYSIASHGNTDCLITRLVPLLEKYRVSAYFSGHDHNLQHIHVPGRKWEVEYFVSGASNFIDPSRKHLNDIPSGSLKYHWGKFFSLGAFTYVETTANKMNVTFIDAIGNQLYSYLLSPRFNNSSFKFS